MNSAPPGWFTRRAAELRLAFMLLSRIPMGHIPEAMPLASGIWAYPLAGAVIGALSGLGFAVAVQAGLPAGAAALVSIFIAVLLTGGMHEDGLADVADGFGGGIGKERKLEIMKDSRIGSYGVIALVLALGLRAELLAALPVTGMVWRLAALGAFSRALLPVLMLVLPPARAQGLGASAGSGVQTRMVMFGLVLGFGLALLLCPRPSVLVAMVIAAALMGWIAKRQIGGYTGDVLGAALLLAELAGLAVLIAL